MKRNKKQTMEWLGEASARGYCTERNKHKVLDPDLIEDMIEEIYREGINQNIKILT